MSNPSESVKMVVSLTVVTTLLAVRRRWLGNMLARLTQSRTVRVR
jgi:type III secretory pathway component EscS